MSNVQAYDCQCYLWVQVNKHQRNHSPLAWTFVQNSFRSQHTERKLEYSSGTILKFASSVVTVEGGIHPKDPPSEKETTVRKYLQHLSECCKDGPLEVQTVTGLILNSAAL